MENRPVKPMLMHEEMRELMKENGIGKTNATVRNI